MTVNTDDEPTREPELIITVGFPACGKTTRAIAFRDEDPRNRKRWNRDDTRDMVHGGWTGDPEFEDEVTAVSEPAIEALLRRGLTVVCDDTHLYPAHVERQRQLAQRCGAKFTIWDMTDVPIDECVERDRQRGLAGGRTVGEAKIRDMHRRWQERQLTSWPV